MKDRKSSGINTKGRRETERGEMEQGGVSEEATSRKEKAAEREPECEGMGGLGNRWAEGGVERWMGKEEGRVGGEAARSSSRKLDFIGIHGGMMATSIPSYPCRHIAFWFLSRGRVMY